MSVTYCDCSGPCHVSGGQSPVSHRGAPGFDSRPFHQGFVVDKVALGLVSIAVLRISPVSIAPPMS
jgi:hypothetical protein